MTLVPVVPLVPVAPFRALTLGEGPAGACLPIRPRLRYARRGPASEHERKPADGRKWRLSVRRGPLPGRRPVALDLALPLQLVPPRDRRAVAGLGGEAVRMSPRTSLALSGGQGGLLTR